MNASLHIDLTDDDVDDVDDKKFLKRDNLLCVHSMRQIT